MDKYSVLMSVYHKEKAEYFSQAIDSMLNQTVPPSDFVLVCDGPLTPELDAVVDDFQTRCPDLFQVIRLPENKGLGVALNKGLAVCKYDLIARMDSDDVSMPDRCRRQCDMFSEDSRLAVASGVVLEFEDTPDVISGERALPCEHEKICAFSRKRSPFNHPAVMYRKSAVLKVGGYRSDYPYLEDYDLWVRILKGGLKSANLKEPLVYMRTVNGLYERRGGLDYARHILAFHADLKRSGWITTADFITGAIPHAAICLLPVKVTKTIYRAMHKR